MRVLIFCHHGQNRSRYLAERLTERGYTDVIFAGVKDPDRQRIQAAIYQADIIITVSPDVYEKLFAYYDFAEKKVIKLDVEDRPEVVFPEGHPLDGEGWLVFQRSHVYPALEQQMSEHLPLEKYLP